MIRSSALWPVATSLALLMGCGSEDSESTNSASDAGHSAGGSGFGTTAPGPTAGSAPEVDESAAIFEAVVMPEFHLTLNSDAIRALEDEPRTYQSGTFQYFSGDDSTEVTVTEIGVRLKGRASFEGIHEKPSFKVKFSEFVSGQRFLGLRRLTLNNMAQDPSAVRERLGYSFLHEAGIVAPRCNYARVYLNDEYYGLYANVETMDESFLDRHFDPPDGNLYDTSNDEYFVDFVPDELRWFELETNQEQGDISDLENLAEAMDGPQESFVEDARSVLDLDQFLRLGAAQAVLADFDGYFGASNNYKLYHELTSDRFVLLPWGIDMTFNYMAGSYTLLDYNIDHSESERPRGIVFTKCMRDDSCYAQYLQSVDEVAGVFDSMGLERELAAMLPGVESALAEDTRTGHSDSEHERSLEAVREFITERAALVRAQLSE